MIVKKINNFDTVSIQMPGSKSYTNRALIIASLTNGKTILNNPLYSDDTKYMIESLKKLGIKFEKFDNKLIVYGNGVNFITNNNIELFCGIAGTTSRFLTGLLPLIKNDIIITGEGKILERPINELVEGLKQIGCEIKYLKKEGSLPLLGNGKNVNQNNEISIKGDVSSQYFTSLMMVAPLMKNGLIINVIGEQISKSYIDITIDIMKSFGVSVINNNYKQYIVKHSQYQPIEYNIEGDWSSASYFICISALTGKIVKISNLNFNSVQGDKKFIDLIKTVGADVQINNNEIIIKKDKINPINIDMQLMPDTAMSIAVLLSFANGISKITGLSTLKNKETDRLIAMQNELKKLSIKTEIGNDYIIIYGGSPKIVGEIETYKDHRIAMSFSIAGTMLGNLKINNPEVVNKSFPEYWNILENFY